jgi:REP element-mobilizing transposase RayT
VTYARKTLVSLTDTPYYHVVARCVRRAWLWGFDDYAERDYSHRKTWVLERLNHLTRVFAIDICAYAVMANHYHLVVHVNRSAARRWSDEEVAARWRDVFGVPPLVERWLRGTAKEAEADTDTAQQLLSGWRQRLHDISWFMRCLNEHLARSNAEDQCAGRFWEGRFKSQALLDEAGLLTAMAYVDLNPIRAGIAVTPESSEFTSIYDRIRLLNAASEAAALANDDAAVPLLAFETNGEIDTVIPYRLADYLELVDWTGRVVRADKRGSIRAGLPPILQRLNIDVEAWQLAMRPGGNVFGRAIGSLSYLRLHARTLGQAWVRGLRKAAQLYGR